MQDWDFWERRNKYLCDFPDFLTGDEISGMTQGRGSQDDKKYTAVLMSWRDRSKFRTAEVSELTGRIPERRYLHWEKATDICTRVALILSWMLSCECTGCDSMRKLSEKEKLQNLWTKQLSQIILGKDPKPC